jgi:hypothetical protein
MSLARERNTFPSYGVCVCVCVYVCVRERERERDRLKSCWALLLKATGYRELSNGMHRPQCGTKETYAFDRRLSFMCSRRY